MLIKQTCYKGILMISGVSRGFAARGGKENCRPLNLNFEKITNIIKIFNDSEKLTNLTK